MGKAFVEYVQENIGWIRIIEPLFTGAVDYDTVEIGNKTYQVVKPGEREAAIKHILEQEAGNTLYAVDFTSQEAALGNIKLCLENGIHLVVGTSMTGEDLVEASKAAKRTGVSMLAAPNMSMGVAAMMRMFKWGAEQFPTVYADFDGTLDESHQASKAKNGIPTVSATAKTIVKDILRKFRINITDEEIKSERNPEIQVSKWNILKKYLDGHGHHKAKWEKKDNTEAYGFFTIINGRKPYARGTGASLFTLRERVEAGSRGEVLSMDDVISNPNLPSLP